jgi:hypothetical protein
MQNKSCGNLIDLFTKSLSYSLFYKYVERIAWYETVRTYKDQMEHLSPINDLLCHPLFFLIFFLLDF